MLIRALSTAALVSAAFLVPVSFPMLAIATVFLVMVPLSIVLWSVLKKDATQARLRIGRWYEFSLDARNGVRKVPRDSEK
jgi:hypothetical protein